MKLILAKFGWYVLPIFLFLVFLGLIWFFFSWLLEKISDSNLYRVVKALSFTFLGVLVALALSSYRQDVPLSVGAKIEQIRVVQAKVEADKVKKEQERLEEQERVKKIREELEAAFDIANTERTRGYRFEKNPSEIITDDWLSDHLDLADEIPDKELKEDYFRRLSNVQKHFLGAD